MNPTVPVSLQVRIVQTQGMVTDNGQRQVSLSAGPVQPVQALDQLPTEPPPLAIYVTIQVSDPELLDNFALGQDLIVTVAAAG